MLERGEYCVWLKKCGEDKRTVLNRSLNRLFRKSKRFAHLTLFSAYTPKQRFEHEVAALEYAISCDLPVPKLLYIGRSWFVTESAGEPIVRARQHSPKLLFTKAMGCLQQLHREEFIHGRPAMRDIVVNQQGEVTLLDLEESRLSDSARLRVRDMALFLLDSYRLSRVSQKTRLDALNLWLQQSDPANTDELYRVTCRLKRLVWIAHTVLLVRNNRLSKQVIMFERLLQRVDFPQRQEVQLSA